MALDVEEVVRRSVRVDAPREHAFDVFTAGLSSWWPLETHHIGAADAAEAVIEPRAGGRWYERGVDGSECDWGRVLAWEPPARVLLAWMLGPDWAFDADDSRSTFVEVTFTPVDERTTIVELTHSGFERVGERGREIAESVSREGGWGGLLEAYAEAAQL